MKINICILNMEVRISAGRRVKFANCVCKCGNLFSTRYEDIRNGKTKSCGCYRKELTGRKLLTHGYARLSVGKSPTYNAWIALRERCTNPRLAGYKNYGGRGITVDPRWNDYETFLFDMGERPNNTSLDRIDNDRGYSKENCRWATRKQQNRNKRSNRWLEINGEKVILIELAERLGMSVTTLHSRLRRGWSLEKVISTPRMKNQFTKFGEC